MQADGLAPLSVIESAGTEITKPRALIQYKDAILAV